MLNVEISLSKNTLSNYSDRSGQQRDFLPDEKLLAFTATLKLKGELIADQKYLMLQKKDAKKLIVVFHGYLQAHHGFSFYALNPLKSSSVLFPQDRHGFNRAGSWHLGKLISYGDKYLHTSIILNNAFLNFLKGTHGFSSIIFSGASMGGFGALCHSYFNNVDQVYLSVPQTTLNPNAHYFKKARTYWETNEIAKQQIISESLQPILPISKFSEFKGLLTSMPYLDVASSFEYIAKNERLNIAGVDYPFKISPYFHLLGTRYDQPMDINGSYMKDMYLPLINSLASSNSNFSIDIIPAAGHDNYFFPSQIEVFNEKHSEFLQPSYLKKSPERASSKYLKENNFFEYHLPYEPLN